MCHACVKYDNKIYIIGGCSEKKQVIGRRRALQEVCSVVLSMTSVRLSNVVGLARTLCVVQYMAYRPENVDTLSGCLKLCRRWCQSLQSQPQVLAGLEHQIKEAIFDLDVLSFSFLLFPLVPNWYAACKQI